MSVGRADTTVLTQRMGIDPNDRPEDIRGLLWAQAAELVEALDKALRERRGDATYIDVSVTLRQPTNPDPLAWLGAS